MRRGRAGSGGEGDGWDFGEVRDKEWEGAAFSEEGVKGGALLQAERSFWSKALRPVGQTREVFIYKVLKSQTSSYPPSFEGPKVSKGRPESPLVGRWGKAPRLLGKREKFLFLKS